MAAYPPWFDPAMPEREDCVLGALLEKGARQCPERVFALFEDGLEWTYAETLELARQWARGLQQLGLNRQDSVLVWLPNGPDILRSWFALACLGAVYAPVNLAYRGGLLEHVIANSGARTMIAHSGLVERLGGLNLAQLERVIVIGEAPDMALPVPLLPASTLDGDADALRPVQPVMPWDTMAVIYTSGTTGPSKGVLCSYLHYYTVGVLAVGFMEPHERCLISMPLFHLGAHAVGRGELYRRCRQAHRGAQQKGGRNEQQQGQAVGRKIVGDDRVGRRRRVESCNSPRAPLTCRIDTVRQRRGRTAPAGAVGEGAGWKTAKCQRRTILVSRRRLRLS